MKATKTVLITSRSVLFGMRNVSDKSGRENQNTHFMYNAVYEIVWKKFVQRGRSQMKIWRM
jgi:hypothetical protein